MYDLLIRNGRILDGTGTPWFAADIGIVGDRIAAMGQLADRAAARVIDARGQFVAPGFIEEHSHADVTILVDPHAQSAVRQGMTTIAVGLCGMSVAPLPLAQSPEYRRVTYCYGFEGYEWTWQSMADYLSTVQAARPSLNLVSFVGHLPLRASVTQHASRPATKQEAAEMRAVATEALAQGARGFTTGLNYQSSIFSDTVELVEIARALRPYGWAYHTHMRDYGARLLDAIREAIAVAEEAEVPLVISHMYPSGRANWGQSAAAIELVEAARQRGLNVGYDVTPWLRGGGPVEQMMPPWARAGGMAAMLDRLKDAATRSRLAHDLEHGGDWLGWSKPEWDEWLICRIGRAKNSPWLGRSVADIACERRMPPAEAAVLMFVEDEAQYWIAPQNKCDEDIDRLVSHPLGVPIADGFTLAPEGPLAYQDRPNSYGTFPRVLGRYVRERGVLTWEQAVQKLTAIPAQRLGLWDRGALKVGLAADVVIFDPATVIERADYAHPQEYPIGINHVIVNGQVTVAPDGHTGARAGRVL